MLILVPTRLELRLLFPELAGRDASVPVAWLPRTSLGEPAWVLRCGFGLAASGARAAAAWSRLPGDACLAGLGGTLDPARASVGSVVLASSVSVEGIGFGSEAAFVHPDGASEALRSEWRSQAPPEPWRPPLAAFVEPMLSVAASSGDESHAALRRARHPSCAVEEMEAHAVLHAAGALGRRLAIARGISNVAGVRDPRTWRSAEALGALRAALDAWLRP